MSIHKITKPYRTKYLNPIQLCIGEEVVLGEAEQEEKWKGWIWAESKTNKGWIPIQIIEFTDAQTKGIIKEAYSAKELNVQAGDTIVKIKSLNGWTWSKNIQTQEEGWIPDEIIE